MDQQTASGRGRLRPARLLPLAVIVAGIVAFFAVGGHQYLNFETLAEHRQQLMKWQQEHHLLFAAAFWVGYAVLVGLSLPGAVWFTLAGGFVFGTWVALIYVVTAATVGAVGIFLAARYALFDWVHARAGERMQKMEEGFRENALSYLLFLRLVPVFPFWLVNLVPALLGVPLRTYALGTFLGIIPGSFVYCSVGSGLGAVIQAGEAPNLDVIFEPHVLTPMVGLAVLSLIPVIYKRRKARAGRS